MLELPKIRPLSERQDIDFVIAEAGGRRAYDEGEHDTRNSDYVLGRSVIELKLLEEERLTKPQAQAKIGSLFGALQPTRPVVVIDPRKLEERDRFAYTAIMEGPIKTAVRSASSQLKQSRGEIDGCETTILWAINNGFSSLSHDEFIDCVVRRARNYKDQIDGVVISGCYLHGDGFDTLSIWPMDYVAIGGQREFLEYQALKSAWNTLAERHMTEFIKGEHGRAATKTVQTDIVFEWEGRTFVKPAIPIGSESSFYGSRRPRLNQVSPERERLVVLTIPQLSPVEYRRIRPAMKEETLLASLDTWNDHIAEALSHGTVLRPVIPMPISRGSWEAWKRRNPGSSGLDSLRAAANSLYNSKAEKLVRDAKELREGVIVPRSYIGVLTELIGQDENNDISHVGVWADKKMQWIISNERLTQREALGLAAAYAIRLGLTQILWRQDLEYAWV